MKRLLKRWYITLRNSITQKVLQSNLIINCCFILLIQITISQIIQECLAQCDDDPDIKIFSEFEIKVNENKRYIDIFIENKREKKALIIELKYVRMTYLLYENNKMFFQGNFEERRPLKDALVRFDGLTKQQILKLKKRESAETNISIEEVNDKV